MKKNYMRPALTITHFYVTERIASSFPTPPGDLNSVTAGPDLGSVFSYGATSVQNQVEITAAPSASPGN